MPGKSYFTCLAALMIVGGQAFAQQTPQPASSAADSFSARSLPPVPIAPAMVSAKARIDFFRRLLALNPAEREQALAAKSEKQRAEIKSKLQEYESLSADEREVRLRFTQLHSYLEPLIRVAPTNRTDQLGLLPEDDRKIVEERLRHWDRLSPAMQEQSLANEKTLLSVLWFGASTLSKPKGTPPTPGTENTLKHAPEVRRWNELSAEGQRRMIGHFEKFLEQPNQEKQRTLMAFPEEDRKRMEETLQAFENLPQSQRRLCIDSFSKFANLSPEERDQFLKNAERWQAMTASERQAWRKIVTELPPQPPEPARKPLPRAESATLVSSNLPAR
jgi:Protein of unknown function (DUF3106)